ncbi:hypothetical protein MUP29_06780 [bacterium]|nr:hypothetical protein [bacterium]
MNTDGKEKQCDSKAERRISKRPRRRLVDLTLMAGTNRRECREERREESVDQSTERLSD